MKIVFIIPILLSSFLYSQQYQIEKYSTYDDREKIAYLKEQQYNIATSAFHENMTCLLELNLIKSCNNSCQISFSSIEKNTKMIPLDIVLAYKSGFLLNLLKDELNPMESMLFESYPLLTYYASYLGRKAFDEAIKLEKTLDPGIGGQTDAFRHAYWNALMTAHISEDFAKLYSSLHEFGATTRKIKTLDKDGRDLYYSDTDSAMDLLNNHIGREIGRNTEKSDLKEVIIKKIKKGELYIIQSGKIVPSNK
jgi:hypothetical protein